MEELFEAWYQAHVAESRREADAELERMQKLAKELKQPCTFNKKAWLTDRITRQRWVIFVPSMGICPKRFLLTTPPQA